MAAPSPPGALGPTSARRSGCRRNYFRVRTRLPARITLLDAAAAERLAEEIRARHREYGPVADPALAGQLLRMEAKLDRLLGLLGYDGPSAVCADDMQSVDLSGSGLCLASPESIPKGSRVRVDLIVPDGRPRRVRALAEVVGHRVDSESGPALALVFRVIDESDRDAIVRHATEVQRTQLRERAGRGRGA